MVLELLQATVIYRHKTQKGIDMKRHLVPGLTLAVLAVATTFPAFADGRHDRHPGHHGWHGERDIRHFESRHVDVWRGGRWRYAHHDGRVGWWWIAAGMWYFYPRPVYPYPDPYIPPVVVVQPAPSAPAPQPPTVVQPQAQSWYYCESGNGYYPYVPVCPEGWKAVPATPPGVPVR